MKYVKSLDGMRAIAILLVMMFHFYYMLEVGWVGVQLFFVLSGYLITSILLEAKQVPLSNYIRRFYWRRILRIFPLYYGYILMVMAAFLVFGIPTDFLELLPYLLTYTYNLRPLFEGFEIDLLFVHFWSLAIEEQFYLFWPFLIYFLSTKQLKIVLPGIVVFGVFVRYLLSYYLMLDVDLTQEQIGETVYRFTFSQFDSLAFGAMIPVFKLKERVKYPGKLLIFSAVVLILLGSINYISLKAEGESLSWTSIGLPIGGVSNYQHLWSYPLLAGFSVALILLVIGDANTAAKRFVRWILESRILVETGKISYGMYVYHWVLFVTYRKLIHPQVESWNISFLLYFVIVFACSWVSFNFFESQFLRLKDRRFLSKRSKESGMSDGH